MDGVVAAVEEAAHELGLLSEVLVRLEREQFQAPLLAALRGSLAAEGAPPSRRMAQLKRLIEYLDSRDNVFVRVAEIFILWTPHLALAVEEWRRRSGPAVRRWLTAVGEIEALCSLASHAFEHPADPFPEFAARAARLLEAEGIGHPLIPEDRAGAQRRVAWAASLRAAGGERLEHVGQEHAAAHAGGQRGAGAGGRAGAGRAAAPVAAGGGRVHPRDRFAAGRRLAVLRGDPAAAADSGSDRRRAAPCCS